MARNTLVINCDIRETRVALIEGGIIAELQIERASSRGTVGNIVLGRVTRVLPGMQAAFIDVGMERAAFLHVEDLIRPHDFDAYLAGARREDAEDRWEKGAGGKRYGQQARTALAEEAVEAATEGEDDDDDDDDDDDEALEAEPAQPSTGGASEADADDAAPATGGDDDDEEDDDDDDEEEEEEEPQEEGENDDEEEDEAFVENATAGGEQGAAGERAPTATRRKRRRRRRRSGPERAEQPSASAPRAEPRSTSAPRAEPRSTSAPRAEPRSTSAPRAEPRSTAGQRNGRGDRGSRERGGRGDAGAERGGRSARGKQRGRNGARPDRRNKSSLRVSRSVPITEVVKEGDEVVVQISKEPIGTKGARVTSHVSLPGRYVVFLPTVEHIGVSKRIGSPRERSRLREVVDTLKPPSGGLIVRTVAEGLTKKSLKADIGYLVRVWEDVSRKKESAKAPTVLYTELDLVLKTARDLFTDEIENIVIDDREQYQRLLRFVEMFMPERAKDIQLYSGDEPIFDAYGIEDEIARALSRKVPLPSGGYLIIDQAEALTAIDVNTGRYVGKGSKDLEETALKTNLEAVDEIAYQLRFRNIGGLVILDLIDMDLGSNREKVWRALEQKLARDKAKTTINRISELGLIEMTRKRTRESLTRTMHETCFYCDGTGQIMSRTTIAYEILRQIRRERHTLAGYSVVVNAHPAVVDLMTGEEKAAVIEAERRYMRRIEFNPRREYHIEQFDLQGK